MSAETIAKCLKEEEECRKKATLSRHPWDEVLWLRLAEDFKSLADEIKERRRARRTEAEDDANQ